MKKKLIALFVFGYMGGSFSVEPLSPFGPNPFASHDNANFPENNRGNPMGGGNPFASHLEEPRREFPNREEPNREFPNREEPRREENAFNQEFSGHRNEQRSEVDTEKNRDTGEDAVVDSEVDTFDQEGSGNWLLKRVWWEKTEGVYEQIKQVFNEIMNARMDYISQRNRLDRELDISYGQIGLEEGELQDIIDYCLDFVKKEKQEQGFLNKQQEDLYNALQHKQNEL